MKKATDEAPLRIGELAEFIGISRTSIYRDVSAGYVFEFATKKLTTPGHYKAWLRVQALRLSETDQTDQERLQHEQHRLRSSAGRSREPQSIRDSQSASPAPAKSTRSPLPA